ncbi:hypothetical protein B0J12DRAFT_700746 [Macrophomina phaseolina]|uniref:Secreted protein n=1 Tax=Macrophomina phaseolina TaxID=35725 RepID=A0ABQ8G9J4_9PEZI|nr:hypothetical protein B0J12DRAFT_700746 [Macrophomina phaseolina]
MHTSASLLLLLLAAPSTILACLQLSCEVKQVCATDADAALKTACDLLGQTRVSGQSLVGREGCGWHTAPAFAAADSPNAQSTCDGTGVLAQGDLAVWRANDDGAIGGMLNRIVYSPHAGATVGPCTVKKTVDC